MIRKLFIRISDNTLEGKSSISEDELEAIKTEVINILGLRVLYKDGTTLTQLKKRAIAVERNKGFSLLEGASITDMLAEKFQIKLFYYQTEYDPVADQEPHILIEIDTK